ncbi:MAG: hypothetical protein R3E12_19345 [Candidatus Eisenbacteria bacterium]|uniref:Uncharacterized protein n=1 Tax=Eiseniibacteriota bacterium TaxID=2212470 RepID=A0A956LXK7_UNCEI|nr:hypothetical protein [Candidatus Eisenbacteria bacterium]
MTPFRLFTGPMRKLGFIGLAATILVSVSVHRSESKNLEAQPIKGGWVNDGTPFEEPELNSLEADLGGGNKATPDGKQSATGTESAEAAPARAASPGTWWIIARELLLRSGWLGF